MAQPDLLPTPYRAHLVGAYAERTGCIRSACESAAGKKLSLHTGTPGEATVYPIPVMVLQRNTALNRRCDEMQRLTQQIREAIECLRLNPENARDLEVKIQHLQRELQAVRRERSEL